MPHLLIYVAIPLVDTLEPESMCPTPEAANEFVLAANDELNPLVSGEHKQAVEHLEPSLSISGGCMESHLNLTAKSSDAHVEIQVPDLKSSEADAHNDLSLHPVSVSHDDTVTKINFKKHSSLELQINCEDPVHKDDKGVSKLLPADDTFEQHNSEAKCTSLNAASSIPSLPAVDNSFSLRHIVERSKCERVSFRG